MSRSLKSYLAFSLLLVWVCSGCKPAPTPTEAEKNRTKEIEEAPIGTLIKMKSGRVMLVIARPEGGATVLPEIFLEPRVMTSEDLGRAAFAVIRPDQADDTRYAAAAKIFFSAVTTTQPAK